MSTYTPIASQTLSAATTSVSFSGIPQTYTDLVIVFSGAITTGFDAINMQFNSDTGTNYSRTVLAGNGSSATSSRDSNASSMQIGIMGTEQSSSIWNVMNYANTTTNKTVISRGNASANSVRANVGLWRSTSAITSITIAAASSTFISGSTFNLYGIDAQASAQAKATGGSSIYTDGTYWYHIFQQSGTFTPSVALNNVDYLVVAGGGAGGNSVDGVISSGGGGAGGLRSTVTATGGGGTLETAKTFAFNTSFTVTVGAGGAGSGGGSSGSDSSISGSGISTITSTGGGRGGGNTNLAANGGSGGGGGNTDAKKAKGTGTANQGFNGSDGSPYPSGAPYYRGGGGGGAGQAGGTNAQGYGGNGVAVSISGSSITYAGGGGGGGGGTGSAGTGGGGDGGIDPTGTPGNGSANTGGGGGGAQKTNNGGNGGSGIVIIRYAV